MATMNISLPDTMREFVEEELTVGGYATASEYFRDLVRTQQRQRAHEKLDALILEGVESGPWIEVNQAFWDKLRADVFAEANSADGR